jgi:MFS family permease
MSAEIAKAEIHAERETFPPGLNNAFLFAGFNALSFQIVLSGPMILYAKSLGASATVLGIMTALMPLLVIFQIPAAHYVHRVGYKRFVYAGWGTRIIFIFLMSVVPLLGFVDGSTRLALILLLLFCFNLFRGISSCAWLPWITSLVPGAIRGRYLVRDGAWVNCASFLVLACSGLVLGTDPESWRFSLLFAFSAAMGATSLVFLKRIPEAATPEEIRSSTIGVPWMAIINYPPFRKMLHMIIVLSFASGGLTTFTIAFLKAQVNLPEGHIVILTSISYIGGLGSLWFLGPRLDRSGSKPILTFSFVTYIAILCGWLGIAGGILTPGLLLILALQFLSGLATALIGMANTRLAMAIIPQMGRNHFFAVYSVLGSLTLGLSPILWGLFIDFLRRLDTLWLGIQWTRFTVFFAAVAAVYVIAIALASRLHEPEAVSFEKLLREILIESPQRVWIRFWTRE